MNHKIGYRFLFLLMIFALVIPVFSHEQSWPGRRLAKLWPEAKQFVRIQKQLTPAQADRIGRVLGTPILVEDRAPVFYFAYSTPDKKSPLGIIIFLDVYAQNGKMEVSLGVDSKGRIARLNVWQHSEGDINSDLFFQQFVGKTFLDFPLKSVLDTNGLSQTTVDAFSVGLQRGLLITTEAFGSDVEKLKNETR